MSSRPRAWIGAAVSTAVAAALLAPTAGPAEAARAGSSVVSREDAEVSPAPVPTITGITNGIESRVDVPLTGVPGTWDPAATLSYRWLLEDEPIDGATTTGYTPQPDDYNLALTFAVTGTRPGYTTVTRVSRDVYVSQGYQALTPTPVIEGAPRVGTVLTAVPGDWDAGMPLFYQWWIDTHRIAGATAATYTPTDQQVDGQLRVEVTGDRHGYAPVIRSSTHVIVTTADAPLSPRPTIAGDPRVGLTVSAVPGAWTGDPTFRYQWFRERYPVAGATSSTYTLSNEDIYSSLTVDVIGTRAGVDTVRSSDVVEVLGGTLDPAPTPTISATPRVGALLKVVPGAWDPHARLSYTWRVDGQGVADTASYRVPAAALGHALTVEVHASAGGYQFEHRTSATRTVLRGAQTLQPRPTVRGTPAVGRTLAAYAGTHDRDVRTTFQWYVGATAVRGATASTLRLPRRYRGQVVRVLSRATKPGYTTVSKYGPALRVR